MCRQLFLKTNLLKKWMKKFVALITKENWLKKEWENDDSDFIRALYSVCNM